MPKKIDFPTLDSFEEKDKEEVKENKDNNKNIDNSKPALAKSIISRYGKYFFIGATVLGIGYKLLFPNTPELQKTNFRKSQAKTTKDNISLALNASRKFEIENKDSMINSLQNDLKLKVRNEKDIKTSIPPLQEPTVPDLNQNIKYNEEQILKERSEKEERERAEALKRESEKVKNEKKDNKALIGLQKPSLDISEKKKEQKDIKNNKNGNNKEQNDLDDDFFVLNQAINRSNSGSENRPTRSAGSSVNDFMILDESIIEIKPSDKQETNSVRKINNMQYTLLRGTILEAVLETSINTESPGIVKAIISKDILSPQDSSLILIPKGSIVTGTYGSDVSIGQERVALIWDRIIRPDGFAITVNSAAMDESGKSGLNGNVDSKYFDLVKNSALFSFITLGTAIATEKIFNITGQTQVVNNNGSVATSGITPTNTALQGIITAATTAAKEMATQFSTAVKPVITIDHGLVVLVGLNDDISLPPYKRYEYSRPIMV